MGLCRHMQKYPRVLFVIGANGMGKTTTIGKIAARLKSEANQTVLVAACDTFRSALLHRAETTRYTVVDRFLGSTEGLSLSVFDLAACLVSSQGCGRGPAGGVDQAERRRHPQACRGADQAHARAGRCHHQGHRRQVRRGE